MRLTVLFILCAFSINAQTKIDFRDGKSMTLNGKLIGTYAKPDFFDASIIDKNIQSYYLLDGDTLEISIYSRYANNSFDDLEIFRIHKNQIDLDNFSVSDETDDEENVTHHSLSFYSLDEQKFHYQKYTIYSSIGEHKEFSVFTLDTDQKEGLEKLFNQINN